MRFLMIGEMAADMSIEIAAYGFRENQPVIHILRNMFINEGPMAFAQCRTQRVRGLVITHLFQGGRLDIGHHMLNDKGRGVVSAPFA